jgi:predicted nucleotidyltransferase
LLKWREYLKILVEAVKEVFGENVEVYIFGSAVEGRLTVDSDIDVAIALNEVPRSGLERAKLLESYDHEALEIIEETCRKYYNRSCSELPPTELPNIPLKMLDNGVSFDIVVETMAILYSTLAYMLNIVASEEISSLVVRRGGEEETQ